MIGYRRAVEIAKQLLSPVSTSLCMWLCAYPTSPLLWECVGKASQSTPRVANVKNQPPNFEKLIPCEELTDA